LRQGNAGEPFQKVVNGSLAFEVLEKSGHGNPCATKHPRASLCGCRGRVVVHVGEQHG
jgi:hypothetical protein